MLRISFPHVAAAIQMSNTNGKVPVKGDMIKYIHTNSEHQNQLNRVVTAGDSINNFDVLFQDANPNL